MVLGACLLPAASGAADPAALVVDVASVVQESDGDDLATVQSMFQGANTPQDGQIAPMAQIIADLKIKRMRILLADVYCDLDTDGSLITAHPNEWDILTQQLDWVLQYGMYPHVAVASTMPESFVPYGPAETWPSAIVHRYRSYADKLIRYIVQYSFDRGGPSVVFEISNELDIADDAPLDFPSAPRLLPLGPWARFLWWIDPATYDISGVPGLPTSYPFGGDPRRVPRGIAPMQKIWADAIATLKADSEFMSNYPGRTIKVAGPAFSGFTFRWADQVPTLEERFLDYMFDPQTAAGQFNAQLDDVSFHYYPHNYYGPDAEPRDFRNGPLGPTTSLKFTTDRLQAKLAALGRPDVKLFLSEWGPTTDVDHDVNYSHKGAALAAAFVTEAVAARITMGSYLVMHDAVGFNPGQPGHASLMHKIIVSGNAVYLPKPAANVFRMFAMMTGTRRAVSGLPATGSNLGAFAASDANSAGVVVFNYDVAFTDHPETFSVELTNLPFSGPVTVERYLVDAQTSNLQAYLEASEPRPDPTLQRVEQFSADVVAGRLVLPSRTLGLGVTFWHVR